MKIHNLVGPATLTYLIASFCSLPLEAYGGALATDTALCHPRLLLPPQYSAKDPCSPLLAASVIRRRAPQNIELALPFPVCKPEVASLLIQCLRTGQPNSDSPSELRYKVPTGPGATMYCPYNMTSSYGVTLPQKSNNGISNPSQIYPSDTRRYTTCPLLPAARSLFPSRTCLHFHPTALH